MDKELKKNFKEQAFSIAIDITKKAAEGGYQKENLSSLLIGLYNTLYDLLCDKEVIEKED
jgi:hypothetical protein